LIFPGAKGGYWYRAGALSQAAEYSGIVCGGKGPTDDNRCSGTTGAFTSTGPRTLDDGYAA